MACRICTIGLCVASFAGTAQAIRGLQDDLLNVLAAEEVDVEAAGQGLKHKHAERAGHRHNEAALPEPTLATRLMWASAARRAMGDAVKLTGGLYNGTTRLALDSGVKLTYGEVLALCGDYYGKREKPISEGPTPADREARFLDSFNCLQSDKSNPTRFLNLTSNTTPSSPCTSYEWLALNNVDLFVAAQGYSFEEQGGLGAWEAYSAGHAAACRVAKAGFQDRRALEKALLLNACASHYLSAGFSAGRMRTPRRFLDEIPWRLMHYEDSRAGLVVENINRQRWRAYGHFSRPDPRLDVGKTYESLAISSSANAVFSAWMGNLESCLLDDATKQAVPKWLDVQRVDAATYSNNSAPLFAVRNQTGTLKGKGQLPPGSTAYGRADPCDMTKYDGYSAYDQATTLTKLASCDILARAKIRFSVNVVG